MLAERASTHHCNMNSRSTRPTSPCLRSKRAASPRSSSARSAGASGTSRCANVSWRARVPVFGAHAFEVIKAHEGSPATPRARTIARCSQVHARSRWYRKNSRAGDQQALRSTGRGRTSTSYKRPAPVTVPRSATIFCAGARTTVSRRGGRARRTARGRCVVQDTRSRSDPEAQFFATEAAVAQHRETRAGNAPSGAPLRVAQHQHRIDHGHRGQQLARAFMRGLACVERPPARCGTECLAYFIERHQRGFRCRRRAGFRRRPRSTRGDLATRRRGGVRAISPAARVRGDAFGEQRTARDHVD